MLEKNWCSPEEELPIKVAQSNRVGIDHWDIFDPWKSQIFKQFTAKTTRANNEYFHIVICQVVDQVPVWFEAISKLTFTFE